MTRKERYLIAQFLNDFSDVLAHRNCNDWDFPADWSREEKISFIRAYHRWNGDPEEFNEDRLILQDDCVASFLASKITDEIL